MPLITHVLKAHERIIMEYGTVSKNTATDRGGGIFVRYTSDSLMPLRQYAAYRVSHASLA